MTKQDRFAIPRVQLSPGEVTTATLRLEAGAE